MIGLIIMFDLYNYPLLMVFVVGLGVVLALSEIGWQLGVRAEGRGSSNLTTLESAMLGLLALMIAFTFSMALSRFETRRDAVLNEANAIGTTALRARLLPEIKDTGAGIKAVRHRSAFSADVHDQNAWYGNGPFDLPIYHRKP